KFVEFYGPGLDDLSLEDQATIANMAPEYGATCGFFPIDADTLVYLQTSGRTPERVALVEAYARAQDRVRETGSAGAEFTGTLERDLPTVVPSRSGPKRAQDRVWLREAAPKFAEPLVDLPGGRVDRNKLPQPNGESRYVDEGATGVHDLP